MLYCVDPQEVLWFLDFLDTFLDALKLYLLYNLG